MDGLIVKQPYASYIINEQKEWELRSRPPPDEKINHEIFLLSSGFAFGKIKITDYWFANKKELERHKNRHLSETKFLDIGHQSAVWEIEVVERFEQPRSYQHPIGARVWVNDVSIGKKSLMTNFV